MTEMGLCYSDTKPVQTRLHFLCSSNDSSGAQPQGDKSLSRRPGCSRCLQALQRNLRWFSAFFLHSASSI